jgi:thiamine biosynthesis lipoprotein
MLHETRILMGMPVTVAIADAAASRHDLDTVFDYFHGVDVRFSPFKKTSETSAVSNGLRREAWSNDMKSIVALAEKTKQETGGYFDLMTPEGKFNPVGIVKGWAIKNAADILRGAGFRNFYIDAGGDVEASGANAHGGKWSVGIKNPFKQDEVVKTVFLTDLGVATSGTYIRGDHIYDPHTGLAANSIISLTVIGPDACEADRFATAAFAMGKEGILFLEERTELEGYMIDKNGMATMTSGFSKYTVSFFQDLNSRS